MYLIQIVDAGSNKLITSYEVPENQINSVDDVQDYALERWQEEHNGEMMPGHYHPFGLKLPKVDE